MPSDPYPPLADSPERRRLYFASGVAVGAALTMVATFALALFAFWQWAVVCAAALVVFTGALQFWRDLNAITAPTATIGRGGRPERSTDGPS